MLRGSDAFLIPFSILWCGFAIFWEWTVVKSNGNLLFTAWGIPFVLTGLHVVFGRFIVDQKTRSATAYGVTNFRVIIISGIFTRSVKSLPLKTLSEITLAERYDRFGTITFGPSNPFASVAGGFTWPGMDRYQIPSFERIPQASDVYRAIRAAQQSAS